MAAGTLDIVIEQGATFKRILTLTDDASPTPNPIDLTGCTARAQVRDKTSNTVSYAFTCTITNAAGGVISVTMSATNTALIPAAVQNKDGKKIDKDYVWDLEIVYADTTVVRLLQGKATLSPEATK